MKSPDKIKKGSDNAGWVEYLPWLTAQLERLAIHSDIKTRLQANGYIIGKKEKDKDKENGKIQRLFQLF